MKKVHKSFIFIFFGKLFIPNVTFAQQDLPGDKCGEIGGILSDNGSIRLSAYIDCIFGTWIKAAQWIFIGVALIFAIYMIWKTATNWDNQDFLKEMPTRWLYIIIFSLVAIGAFGTILNIIVFPLLGLGGVKTWLTPVNDALEILKNLEEKFWAGS